MHTLLFVKPFANTNVSAPVIGGNSTALDATLVVAGCSEVMKRFLRMALARDPKRRPAAKDILSDLKRFHQKKAPSVESGPNFALQEGDAFDLSGYSQAKKLGKGATADVFRYIKEGSEGAHSKIAIKQYREPGYDTIQIYTYVLKPVLGNLSTKILHFNSSIREHELDKNKAKYNFQREKNCFKLCKGHPCIVEVLGYGLSDTDQQPWIAMEHCPGSLQNIIKEETTTQEAQQPKRKLQQDEICHILSDILEATIFLHGKDIIHRCVAICCPVRNIKERLFRDNLHITIMSQRSEAWEHTSPMERPGWLS